MADSCSVDQYETTVDEPGKQCRKIFERTQGVNRHPDETPNSREILMGPESRLTGTDQYRSVGTVVHDPTGRERSECSRFSCPSWSDDGNRSTSLGPKVTRGEQS